MARKQSLVFRLTLYTLAIVALMVVIILIYNYRISRAYILEDARKDAKNLTSLTINQIENILNRVEQIPVEFAYYLDNSHDSRIDLELMISTILERFPLVSGACVAYLPGMYQPDTLYYAPYVYRENEQVKFRNLASADYRYWEKGWFVKPVEENRASWSEPYFDQGGGETIMSTYSVPFYKISDKDSVMAGVVTVDISLDRLQDLISSIKLYKSGYAMLITSAGNIVTHPLIESGRERNLDELPDGAMGSGLKMVFSTIFGQQQGLISMEDYAGKQYRNDWVSFETIPSNEWYVLIFFNERELYYEIRKLTYSLVFIGFVGILLISLLLYLMSRNITRPLVSLVNAAREIGNGNLSASLPLIRTKDEVGQLGNAFRYMQEELEQYMINLENATSEREKIDSEIRIAARIQDEMLPAHMPEGRLNEHIVLSGQVIPARIIGGDLFDYWLHENGNLFFLIGDVSGKGIPAALFMARTISLFRAMISGTSGIEEIVQNMNAELSRNNSDAMFTTLFAGIMDTSAQSLTYCNAGHNPPFLVRSSGEILNLTMIHGTPVGVLEDGEYSASTISLSVGDVLCMYSDGITEAENSKGEFFGEKKLLNTILTCKTGDPDKLRKKVLEEVRHFTSGETQSDDITLFVIAYK
ncbi:MAG: SpoIIE family protein phosphatase [Bacteroidetes bacterium]|nr:SpoIIE family protein phosphatase [Bacteroidota bacterium]